MSSCFHYYHCAKEYDSWSYVLQKPCQEVQIATVGIESWDTERWRRTLLLKIAGRKYHQAVGPLKVAIDSITRQDGPEKRKNKATSSQPNNWKVILAEGRRYHTAVTASIHRSQTGGESVPFRHPLGSSIWDLVKRDNSRLFLFWKWGTRDRGILKLYFH